jgi:hypothetical protein
MRKNGFLAIIAVFGCLLMGGCEALNIVEIITTPTYGEEKIPAEYDLKANSKGGILIYVEPSIGSGVGISLQKDVSDVIKGYMVKKAKIKGGYVNAQSKISLVRAEGDRFKGLSPVQIGKKLSAGLVLHVRIENYGLYQMSDRGYYNGSMATRSMLYEVESGKLVWPADEGGKLIRTHVELETGGRKPTADRLIQATGFCIVRNFYNCIRNQYKITDEVEDYNAEKYW